ncbi:dynamin family protein [Caballeronia humi]|uniref:GTP-binding protein, HSR1-related n=1 Tax=Caballeronia humi TaxID=326474 RepID=A0A158HVD0_9BURK|nr:dynamin family protein [Caballeronia humi]SAL48322.1 GTP-binding protein, HSR1-related [Caballeronia humi]
MKADVTNEQGFIAEVDAFEFIAHDVEKMLRLLEDWFERLTSDLHHNRLAHSGLKEHSALAVQAEAINAVLKESAPRWTQHWANLEHARSLAESFDDKALLLVFGKFNAGKSSFCNFLAERFASYGKTVAYFHLDGGRIVETNERFKEGVTETTVRLQGVRLAGNLVLVDTPGLHSVTPENAALTQRFTDSADGVLWLTSSTSPGQVQELDELGRELHRNKPLLPIVTRSDVYEEDEIDGEIRKVLRNKTAQNRAEQEADVKARAEEKLLGMDVPSELLKAPVSISSYLAREQGQTRAAMAEAGFERLYAALLAIAEPTLAYKRRKRAEVLLHHLEENVMGVLCGDVLSLISVLRASSETALDALERHQEQISSAVWRSVIPTLPELLDKHSAKRDVAAICGSLSRSIIASFTREANTLLSDYCMEPDASLAEIKLDADARFEEHVVGVDYQRLHAALGKAIRKRILQLSSDAAEQGRDSIAQLMVRANRLENSLRTRQNDLLHLKQKLRSEFS